MNNLARDMAFSQLPEHKTARFNARTELQAALKEGRVFKPDSCDVCGRLTPRNLITGHHWNYDRPLDVVWMCRACHYNHHNFVRSTDEYTDVHIILRPEESRAIERAAEIGEATTPIR